MHAIPEDLQDRECERRVVGVLGSTSSNSGVRRQSHVPIRLRFMSRDHSPPAGRTTGWAIIGAIDTCIGLTRDSLEKCEDGTR